MILLTVSPNRLNNLITPAPLNVAVLTALGSSSLLCRKFMKSGSEQRIGCCDVRRKNRSNAARRFSIHSELAPFPGSVGVCALILTFVEPKVIENLLFFKHLRDSVRAEVIVAHIPIKFFSGAGGMMRPKRRYLLTRRSCKPRKSLNRRNVLNCFALNFGKLVCVETLFGNKRKCNLIVY